MDAASDEIMVATEKPKRGREMITTAIPDMFDSMKASDKKDEELLPKEKVETYYEGYVDGKRFLVPDSNLEAMKDIINLSMRPRKSTRFRHQTSADIEDDMTLERIDKILAKLQDLRFSALSEYSGTNSVVKPIEEDLPKEGASKQGSFSRKDSSSEEDSSEEGSFSTAQSLSGEEIASRNTSFSRDDSAADEKTPPGTNRLSREEKSPGGDVPSEKLRSSREPRISGEKTSPRQKSFSRKQSSSGEDSSKEGSLLREDSSREDKSSEKEISPEEENLSTEESSLRRKRSPKEDETSQDEEFERQSSGLADKEVDSEECHLRLILSGHFKNGEKPMYIIEEYDKETVVFNKQSADFNSSQKQGNVQIFISGKLFKENILQEFEGKPKYLKIKPHKILIDANKSKVFYNYFENTYNKDAKDITIKGEFIRNELSITPFLSLLIRKHINTRSSAANQNNMVWENQIRPNSILINRAIIPSEGIFPKETKRVSFKELSDNDSVHFLYNNKKKKSIGNTPSIQENISHEAASDRNKSKKKAKENHSKTSENKNTGGIFSFSTHNFLKHLFLNRKNKN